MIGLLSAFVMQGQTENPVQKVQEAIESGVCSADENIDYLNFISERSFEITDFKEGTDYYFLSEIKHKMTGQSLTANQVLSEEFNILFYDIPDHSGPVNLYSIEGTGQVLRIFDQDTLEALFLREQTKNQ